MTKMKIYLVIILGGVLFIPALAFASTTSTEPGTTTSTPEIIIPTSTTEIASTTETGITNQVVIQYLDQKIFNNEVYTTSTWFYDTDNNLYSNTSSISALGVLAQAGRDGNFNIDIQNGWGYYVSGISNIEALGFDGWIYNVNMADPGWTALNDYILEDGDALIVYYSLWPWKIETNTSSVYQDEEVIFTASNYSSSTWNNSPSTTISINNELFVTNENGNYNYSTSTTRTLQAYIYGTPDWPQNSPAINIEILENISTPSSTTTSTPEDSESGSGSGGGGNGNTPPAGGGSTPEENSNSQIQNAVNKILDFIKSNQNSEAKIIDGGISDWSAMAFSSANQNSYNIKTGEKSLAQAILDYNFEDPADLNTCASYPRHILALNSLGYNLEDEEIINLIQEIKNNCISNIYGLNGINDDVFALIALLNNNEDINSKIINVIKTTILNDQQDSGAFTWAGFAGADITGAVINSLKFAKEKGVSIDDNIFTNAKNYLKNNQLDDGGWGYGTSDVLTTSWAVMGINALGENQSDWWKNNKNPWHILVDNLSDEGYYESAWAPGTTDWFAIKHAVPALLGYSWPVPSISKPTPEPADNNAGGDYIPPAPEETNTTTLKISTSTPDISTSTPGIITTTTLEIIIPTSTSTTTPAEILEIEPKLSSRTTPDTTTASLHQTQAPLPVLTPNTMPAEPEKSTSSVFLKTLAKNPKSNTKFIDSLPLDTPTKKAAKAMMTVSGGGSLALGLYMALKFLKNLI